MCPNRNDHNKIFTTSVTFYSTQKPYNVIFVACNIYWDYNSLIVSDGTDHVFRVKHFINYVKTNIIIFIIVMIIKFSIKRSKFV